MGTPRLDHVAFTIDVERKLLANSGAHCANPVCRGTLFPTEGDVIVTVAEMAHVIGKSPKGPRGDSPLPLGERDQYDNAVLLCPNCHTLVDTMKRTDKYDEAKLRQWKAEREREVVQAAGATAFASRGEVLEAIRGLLAKNRAIFEMVGPGGPQFEDPFSEMASQWRHQLREHIAPNNWRVVALAKRNQGHLTQEERQAIAEFSVHADSVAHNALAGRPRDGSPRFPESMKKAFG